MHYFGLQSRVGCPRLNTRRTVTPPHYCDNGKGNKEVHIKQFPVTLVGSKYQGSRF